MIDLYLWLKHIKRMVLCHCFLLNAVSHFHRNPQNMILIFISESLTVMSHQNSATSPVLMEHNRVSQMSSLNMLPITISMGVPTTLLSSITVRSSSHNVVRKWNVTWRNKSQDKEESHEWFYESVIMLWPQWNYMFPQKMKKIQKLQHRK